MFDPDTGESLTSNTSWCSCDGEHICPFELGTFENQEKKEVPFRETSRPEREREKQRRRMSLGNN